MNVIHPSPSYPACLSVTCTCRASDVHRIFEVVANVFIFIFASFAKALVMICHNSGGYLSRGG